MARQLERFENLVSLFLTRASEKGDAPFLWSKHGGEWQKTSWAEAARQVAGLAASLKQIVDNYLGAGGESLLDDPRVSPQRSPHLDRFPPTQLLVGTRDALLGQSRAFEEGLRGAGEGLVGGRELGVRS